MGVKDGKCPYCGEWVNTSGGAVTEFCPHCGAQLSSHTDYAQASNNAYANGSQGAMNPQGMVYSQNAPLLNSWKTEAVFVVLGIVAIGLFNAALNALASYVYDYSTLIGLLVVNVALVVATIVYALVYYPSFFGPEPKLRSNKTISFWNGFFGGIIFGCLWCSNLTKKQKGISYIVLAVIGGIGILYILMLLIS